jgi:sugar phosphate isomerase/epimerase
LRQLTRRRFLGNSAAAAAATAFWPALKIASASSPSLQFPTAAHDRVAVASYPFREFIIGPRDNDKTPTQQTVELKDFAAHVISKFGVNKIEPWSLHFPSTDTKYLEDLRANLDKSRASIINIAVDGEHSPYAADKSERDQCVAFRKHWIDVAVAVGSPSVRTNMPPAKDSQPDVDRAAESFKQIADYGASKNIVVNLENDNSQSEDPFFIVKVIEKVNSPWLHANPDFCNTLTTGKTDYAYKGIAAMFAHAYSICHVKSMEADEKGQLVHVDMEKTFGILKDSHYKGYLSMEFDSPGDPYAGTSALIQKTLQALS